MPIQTFQEDILPHVKATPSLWNETVNPTPPSLEERVALSQMCLTLFTFARASVKVCLGITGSKVHVSVEFNTPLGNVSLGSATLTDDHPAVKLSGSVAGFKSEVEVELDVDATKLAIQGIVCAPVLGCRKGDVTISM